MPDSPRYATPSCRVYREEGRERNGIPMGAGMTGLTQATYRRMAALQNPEVCGDDPTDCFGAMDRGWRWTIDAAERWNDTSGDCRFTALIGYEYSMTPDLSKVHRNVLFKNANVPPTPISWVHETTPWGLWRRLRADCVEAGNGCDALTIPHNPNLSNGQLFAIEYDSAGDVAGQAAAARLRQRMEPLAEIMQVKGDSECRQGMWGVVGSDEWCGFEKFDFNIFRPGSGPPPDCEDGTGEGALAGRGCLSRRSEWPVLTGRARPRPPRPPSPSRSPPLLGRGPRAATSLGTATITERPPAPKISPSGGTTTFNSEASTPKNSAAWLVASLTLSATNSFGSWR